MKNVFLPCHHLLSHLAWARSGAQFTAKQQKYQYHKGDVVNFREQVENLLYDPILPFALKNCKRNLLPRKIILKYEILPDFGPLLLNRGAVWTLIIGKQLGYYPDYLYELINIGPFAEIVSKTIIKKFYHYLWDFPDWQRKLADDFLMGIKNPHRFVRMYQKLRSDRLTIKSLAAFFGGNVDRGQLKETMMALIQYHMEESVGCALIGDLDTEEQHVSIANRVSNTINNF